MDPEINLGVALLMKEGFGGSRGAKPLVPAFFDIFGLKKVIIFIELAMIKIM